jgi:hypothetical protein
VDWGEGRLVEVAPPEAGNTWAPEAVWDPQQEAYLVHWSSTLYDNAGHEGESYNRIMYATTRDFRDFSETRVWIDRGWSTIDATVIESGGLYYRFVKDERARGGHAPTGKSVFSETAESLTAVSRTLRTSGSSGSMSLRRNAATSPSRRPTWRMANGLLRRTSGCR